MTQKIAVTRSVKEWRQAAGSGNQAYADQIAGASGQLGLKPRYVENISGGGMEAGVDKMIGRAMGPEVNQSGYLAQKVYKPDSPIATGRNMSNLLQTKQDMTNEARSLSPEAKNMVPAMYGHKEIQGPNGSLTHVSQHEYVPGAQSLRRDPNAMEHVQNIEKTVSGPMAARGKAMGDIPRTVGAKGIGPIGLGGNLSNAVVTPQGPKVIDFLPSAMGGTSTKPGGMGVMGVMKKGLHDNVATDLGSGAADTAFGKGNMNSLRQQVFRPGSVAKAAPAAAPTGLATRVEGAATKLTKPVASVANAATRVTKPVSSLANAATRVLGKVAHMINFSSFCEELSDYKHALPLLKQAEDSVLENVKKKYPHLVAKPSAPKPEIKKEAGWKDTAQIAGILGAGAVLPAGVAMGSIYMGLGASGRKQFNSEIRDPRLYSNLRGAFESQSDRIAAHKKLDMKKEYTVTEAMREGFTRGAAHQKQASAAGMIGKAMSGKGGTLKRVGEHLADHGNAYDLAGLGVLAAPSAANLHHAVKQHRAGGPVDKKEVAHSAAEIGGLGLIAAPVAAAALMGRGH